MKNSKNKVLLWILIGLAALFYAAAYVYIK